MTTAKSSLIFNKQDDTMLSCTRWFVSVMVYSFNLNLVVLCVLSFGLFGAMTPTKTQAIESAAYKIQIEEDSSILNQEDILLNWIEAKAAKYAKYKVNYPKDGIVHAKGLVPVKQGTVRVNILEVNRDINPNLEIKPAIASDYLNSKVKIRSIADKTNAVAAVNGGYFKPQTGVPLGALVIDNELLTGPVYNRVALGINGDSTFSMGKTDIKFALKNKNLNIKVDNINQPRMLSTYTLLYTDKWGKTSPPPPKYGANVIVKDGVASGFYRVAVNIPKGGYVVSAPDEVIKKILNQKKLKFEIRYPECFQKSDHLISGGPYLVKDGQIFIDTKEEKLTAIAGRNPRTLVGYTKNNELIIATIDGREEKSVGMNLYEAADFMKKLGCIQAMNLDGGSSSVMYVNGQITNAPPTVGGIPISNTLNINTNEVISKK